jgi:DDE superfamily endonuclease
VDGTLFPLAFEPETEDVPNYSGRKYGYSITATIFCDHKRRIRHYLAGFLGSAHDKNRVFKASKLASNPNLHISPREYCIGNSAFENSRFMVSAIKKPRGESIPKKAHEKFNEKLARLCIISEHCIGILKGRFPWLRSIHMKITEEKKSLWRILNLLESTVIVHNDVLLEWGEEERNEWIDYDDFSNLDLPRELLMKMETLLIKLFPMVLLRMNKEHASCTSTTSRNTTTLLIANHVNYAHFTILCHGRLLLCINDLGHLRIEAKNLLVGPVVVLF